MTKKNLPEHLQRILCFLQVNSKWNREFQGSEYRSRLMAHKSPLERLKRMLYTTANTQAKPSMSLLAGFWKHLNQFHPRDTFTLATFSEHLAKREQSNLKSEKPWEELFDLLLDQPGWGSKTAALFVKAAIQIHRWEPSLGFFASAPVSAIELRKDKVYLPVDAVITRVFQELGMSNPTFHTINELLHEHCSTSDMLLWDDLWYWGFFTQFTKNGVRKIGWNTEKFWGQPATPKMSEENVKVLGGHFVDLLRQR